jgi:hypothetical protein
VQNIQLKHLVLGTGIQKYVQKNIDGDPQTYTLSILPFGDNQFALDRRRFATNTTAKHIVGETLINC